MLGTTEGRFALSANRTTDCLGVQHLHRQGSRTAGRRNSVEGEVALRAEPAVFAEGRGSPGGVLLGSERRRRPSRADVEGAQTSGNHSEKRAGQMLLQVIDSAIVQSFGEAQVRRLHSCATGREAARR